ncbi:hypothetical protein [Alterisphingorhabdus coralli]|uniref:Uncharacterized protein n=1 Tax=Alterisphingorhabdus coralli TaxID=3071408 RepID=A0AA97F6P7_9SPHN|nr:hypothetical protein [Parasphingorhabdus sp. SCSIO 66989]WOE75369.1 hypothetical protein RB602_01240 [Parasphingorhabdus sp. SCSIO 66989]
MEDVLDWMSLANKKPKGKRPDFLGDPHDERLLSMLLAVIGEVSVLRERMDTVERLLEAKGTISREDIESYTPDADAAYERGAMIREYIFRVMRGPQQMMEELQSTEPPVESISEELINS